jgi:para-nitrobenzyl esterase
MGRPPCPCNWGDQLAHKGVIESPHHSSGNYGLMDQIAALKWIQKALVATLKK